MKDLDSRGRGRDIVEVAAAGRTLAAISGAVLTIALALTAVHTLAGGLALLIAEDSVTVGVKTFQYFRFTLGNESIELRALLIGQRAVPVGIKAAQGHFFTMCFAGGFALGLVELAVAVGVKLRQDFFLGGTVRALLILLPLRTLATGAGVFALRLIAVTIAVAYCGGFCMSETGREQAADN